MTSNTIPPPGKGGTAVYAARNDPVEILKIVCGGLLLVCILAFLLSCYGII